MFDCFSPTQPIRACGTTDRPPGQDLMMRRKSNIAVSLNSQRPLHPVQQKNWGGAVTLIRMCGIGKTVPSVICILFPEVICMLGSTMLLVNTGVSAF